MKIALCALLLFSTSTSLVSSQTPAAEESSSHRDRLSVRSISDLPEVRLQIGEAKPVEGVGGSPLIANQKRCAPDGVIFMKMAVPPLYRERTVVALRDSNGGNGFSLSSMPQSLHGVALVDYFPSDSDVAILVTATKESSQSDLHARTLDGKEVSAGRGFHGEFHNYIVIFDKNGSYESLIDLPESEDFLKMARTESGEFILLGFSRVNHAADLDLFTDSGQFIRNLQLPQGALDPPPLSQSGTEDSADPNRALTALGLWEFVSTKGGILLFRPGRIDSLHEITSTGVIRKVRLEVPKGYQLDGFVPSNDRWIALFRRIGLDEKGPIDAGAASGNFVMFDVNPLDGSLRTQLKIPDEYTVFDVACESDGELTIVTVDDKFTFRLAKADIPK